MKFAFATALLAFSQVQAVEVATEIESVHDAYEHHGVHAKATVVKAVVYKSYGHYNGHGHHSYSTNSSSSDSSYDSHDYSSSDHGYGYRYHHGHHRYYRYRPVYHSGRYYYGHRYANASGHYKAAYRGYKHVSYTTGHYGHHDGHY